MEKTELKQNQQMNVIQYLKLALNEVNRNKAIKQLINDSIITLNHLSLSIKEMKTSALYTLEFPNPGVFSNFTNFDLDIYISLLDNIESKIDILIFDLANHFEAKYQWVIFDTINNIGGFISELLYDKTFHGIIYNLKSEMLLQSIIDVLEVVNIQLNEYKTD